ncbi:formate dehydrogenase accessory sulfurtransferase FdhD [Neptuniibacter sp. CAU 1671]|uniref:formate dehydrogenase accessory sulfurtransferase FdhD n=1 Tax=Neptuniibacter sp. CAU 1671 TaxID=3032593 RepID=UPI0023DA59A9|nr:formate dehydrogenase accessory sulfurtransferase FdhD [Neptuniibacter sp. CAU 1671]MDF2180529.1 formate dehydrogenase accessory sulfurtransferase FdhD [Neptuniibacter sp. CAU 1671]
MLKVEVSTLTSWVMDITLSSRASHHYRSRAVARRMAGCGVCGTQQLAEVFPSLNRLDDRVMPSLSSFGDLHQRLDDWQSQQSPHGGLHAAVLLDREGQIITIQEDIGRHNAMDKVIGYGLNSGLNLTEHSIVMSSRSSVELVYKAINAGLGCLVHLSSPSYQAVMMAQQHGLNLIQQTRQGEVRIFSKNQ